MNRQGEPALSDLDADTAASSSIASTNRVEPSRFAPSWDVLTLWCRSTRDASCPRLPDGAAQAWFTPDLLQHEERLLGLCAEVALPLDHLRRRFADGNHLAALRCGGPIASYGWVATSSTWIKETAGWFVPPRGQAYIWDCVTRAHYRGQGLYTLLLSCIARRLGDSDVDSVWIAVEWANWRSVSGIIHAGFRPVGAVVTLKLGRLAIRKLIANPNATNDDVHALRGALRG